MNRLMSPFARSFNLRIVALLLCIPFASAQNGAPVSDASQTPAATPQTSNTVSPPAGDAAEPRTKSPDASAPLIGSGDEVDIAIFGAPDLSTHARVSSDGYIFMPLIGDVQVAGLTSRQAEMAIAARLRRNNIVNNPQVSVYVKDYTSSGISVVGQVAKPGIYSPLGPHRLLDVLQAAGGLTEKAASEASISHRDGGSAITVQLPNNPGEMARNNVELLPGDTVVVPSASIVYVLGEVNKPGGYILNSSGSTTVLRVLAAAGGPTRIAGIGGTKMIRRTPSGLHELPIPLKDIVHAKVADIPLEPDDILYIPSSRIKGALNLGSLITTAGTVALYRVP